MMLPPLILASQSPRRSGILRQLNIPFDVVPSPAVESNPAPNENPADYCIRNAREKAQAVAGNHLFRIILGADTIVVVQGKIMGKPRTRSEAAQMLAILAGASHDVITGLALITESGRIQQDYERTSVTFRELEDQECDWYLNTHEWRDKAGGYGIQGYGAGLVERVEGCFYNVVGLPTGKLISLLQKYAPKYWPPIPAPDSLE